MAITQRKVRVRITMEYDMDFLSHMTNDSIEFYLNDGTYCFSNVIDDMKKLDKKLGCLCPIMKAKVINKKKGDI